ncbi:flagellar basal body P-ring formation chaperone FlgA [Xinfangfangia sp. CPCC 101601]|uniref:Flagella basal body P-ring formation protein FlgA n=1 Tax=Pseudogemmobacter lacusdianii TaxID=3069608 RepID=A0ABU0VU93_9RHOB|nr:flagellar basal body P-ring formation chaperone FlgA [Xinfangfangia sp. CPCC 101601]MDQ2065296.1 flagellar basal body P-ring formation chaperone FlgA [Xinfangfangia sp. CPCC 101601]
MLRAVILVLAMPISASAESLVALRTLPARTVITEADVALVDAKIDGALTALTPALGQEVKITVYAGRPLRAADIGPAALIDRNQTVQLVYHMAGLTILAEGRALERGPEGAVIRAMNIASKTTISGRVDALGRLIVGAAP